MRFANSWEIDEAVRRYGAHPVLGPAARLLAAVRDLADARSDGWAHYPAPVRACRRLIDMIYDPAGASADALRKAVAPVRAFCTRAGWKFPDF